MKELLFRPDFEAWRQAARQAAGAGLGPDDVVWVPETDEGLKFGGAAPAEFSLVSAALRVPPAFMEKARLVAVHREPARWSLLYRALWRLTHGEPHLLEVAADPDVRRIDTWSKQVSRDIHKMHAFVRFRKLGDGSERFVAWHRPDHGIVRLGTPFFARRFAAMKWSILTPDESALWDGKDLTFAPGVPESMAPRAPDELEDLWRQYYASIFNPARVKIGAMKKEMPVRHWRTLPEASLIDELLADSGARVEQMIAAQPRSARDVVPAGASWAELRAAAAGCRACRQCEGATQTVFGTGPLSAQIMLVGEQPGDQEDLAGLPFVGPAGQLLDRALGEVGLPRAELYLTNAVKHFRYKEEGKRRIHMKPEQASIAACKPWLEAEINAVRPRVLVCLGLTAAQAVSGRLVRLADERGKLFASAWAPQTLITAHPSSILRQPPAERAAAYAALVDDLRLARDA